MKTIAIETNGLSRMAMYDLIISFVYRVVDLKWFKEIRFFSNLKFASKRDFN